MHWFDRYIEESKEFCWNRDECNGDCLYCDEFLQSLADDIGENERVWPYHYLTQEDYIVACEFANEADEIVSDEERQWWCSDPGFFRGISSPAVDPRDFSKREDYVEELYHRLFAEAVAHHPEIPFTELWYRVFVDSLENSESFFCAEKTVLGILDEICYDNDQFGKAVIGICQIEQEHEIRYSTWDKDCFAREHYDCRRHSRILTSHRRVEEYTAHQFRNDLLYHYPELFLLVSRVATKECAYYDALSDYGIIKVPLENGFCRATSRTEENTFEYLPDVVINALYLHDLYGFDVEECVQNGVAGLIKALKNGLWYQNTQFYERGDYLKWEIRVNMVQYSLEIVEHFGFSINRKTAKAIESIIYDRRKVNDVSVYDLCEDYRVTSQEYYLLERIGAFFEERDHGFSTISLCREEEFTNYDEELFRVEAISLLRKMVEQLPAREQEYLSKRYGLHGGVPKTLEEIAVEHNHTKEWARQVEKKALELLKKMPEILSLCELTCKPVPEGAKYLSFVQEHVEKSQPIQSSNGIDNQKAKVSLKIKDCNFSIRAYNAMNRNGIVFVDQLLELNVESLQEISINAKIWYEIATRLKEAGIVPSEAITLTARPYRPPTNHRICDCGFTQKFKRVMDRAYISRVNTLQVMNVTELKKYRSLSTEDWVEVDKRMRELGIIPSEAIMEIAGTTYD